MNVYGIEFKHRRPEVAEGVAGDFARFTAFAALCENAGVAHFVNSVFFDTKWQGFSINVDRSLENTDCHRTIKECAALSLPQFDLFGTYGEWHRAESLWPREDGKPGEIPF